MSGWTCITLEPGRSDEEEIPDESLIQSIIDRQQRLYNAYEEEETDQLSTQLHNLVDEAEQALKQTGDVDPEEKVVDYIEREWQMRGESPLISWRNTPTFQYPDRHGASYTNEPAAEGIAERLLDECEYVQRVLIVSANDTSDSGAGELYERGDDGSPELVDHWTGYEGAVGRDVTGYFSEEHSISGCASPF